MKRLALTFAGVALLCGLAFGLSSCMADASVGVGYDYAYAEGPWMYGHDWYHHNHYERHGWSYVHPPRG